MARSDDEAQARAGVIRGTTRGSRLGTLEPELRHVELVDERVNGPHRVVLGDPVVQPFREQRGLRSTLTFDEPLQRAPLRVAR